MCTVFDVVLFSLNDRDFAKLGGGRDKGDFYFPKFIFLKNCEKIFSQSNFFKICFEYIKNNSYINLDDGNHIRVVWSCSNAVKTHNVSYIP